MPREGLKDNAMALEIKAMKNRSRLIALFYSLGGIAFSIGVVIWEPELFVIAFYAACLWTVISVIDNAGSYRNIPRYRRLRSGLSGEKAVFDIGAQLESCVVRNQVLLPNDRSRTGHTEADFIVIGKKALYLVETKNNAGRISVKDAGKEWSVMLPNGQKTTMRNPIQQVKVQGRVLKDRLAEIGVTLDIQLLVAFPSPEARLVLTAPASIPVISYPLSGLVDWINDNEQQREGRPDIDQVRIGAILDRFHITAQSQQRQIAPNKKGT